MDDLRKHNKPKAKLTEEDIQRVKEFFSNNPKCSIRRGAQSLNINRETLRRCLKKVLRLFPYKISTVQVLSETAMQQRRQFSGQLLGLLEGDTVPANKIIFSDEAHFHLDGYVNRQNYRFWGSENPRLVVEKSLHPQRVTVWAAMTVRGIYLTHFTETVNAGRYIDLLQTKWFPFAQKNNVVDGYYFMQDGAPPHRTKDVFDALHAVYGERIIGYGYPAHTFVGLDWPTYSPDLNACDYFLWRYLKDRI